jgi:alpha-tubulin suppressor-like RCC1 family protein
MPIQEGDPMFEPMSAPRRLPRLCHLLATALVAATLAACGGGNDDDGRRSPAATGTATVGRAGGVLVHEDGARVNVPPEAFAQDLKLQIAKDGTGAPPLPALLEPAGAVYAITPHGGGFERPVEVVVPVQMTSLAHNEQLLLVTAQAGSSQWHVLSDATFDNGVLRAQVAHFSFFQAVVIRDQQVPALVVTIDNKNNSGAGGAQVIAPGFEISTGYTDETWNPATGNSTFTFVNNPHELVARLRFPAPPLRGAAVPATTCAPASYGPEGAAWRFQRGLQILPSPQVIHRAFIAPPTKGYPAQESQLDWSASPDTFAGFGALHFFGQDNPRRGELAGTATDPWATPPTGNALADDLLTWRGQVRFNPTLHNGAMLVSVTVPTACGLFIEAAPHSFRLNEDAGWGRFDGLHAVDEQTQAVATEPVTMSFQVSGPTMAVDSVEWFYSTDRQNWGPLPSGALPSGHQITIASPNLDHHGYYRANACGSNIDPDLATPSTCIAGRPTQLVLVPGDPQVVSVDTDIHAVEGRPVDVLGMANGFGTPVRITWQKRSLAAAAFGFTTWSDLGNTPVANSSCNDPFADALAYVFGIPVAVCTLSTLTLTPVLEDTGTQFRMVATNSRGVVASVPMTLFVTAQATPPTVVSHPASLTVQSGSSAAFVAGLTGARPMDYQWQFNETDLVGANSATLTLNNVAAAQAGRYRLVVRNAHGATVTLAATLTVTEPGAPAPVTPPVIAAQPIGMTVTEGQAAQLAVGVTGAGPLGFQWFKDGAPLAGATGAGLSFNPAFAVAAGSYTVRVSNGAGSVTSNAAVLAVNLAPLPPAPLPPMITTAPAGLAVLPGSAATLAVAATGTGPLTYQWQRDGADLPGATGAVLHLPAVTSLDAGAYRVAVRNAAGGVVSPSATLLVIGAPAISTQPIARSADQGATATFTVAATGPDLRYQWLKSGVGIAGADQASYTTAALSPADHGAVYSVIAYNAAGVVVSQGAALTVLAKTPAATADDKIAAGLNHSCAVARDGTLHCWGNGASGEIGDGAATYRDVPTLVPGLAGVRSVAAGSWDTCAIDGNDALWCWGAMRDMLPTRLSGSGVRVTSVSLGSYHGCYVDGAGEVYCWGRSTFGQAGEAGGIVNWPGRVRRADGNALAGVLAVAVGVNHSCAQLADNSVWCWGAGVAFGTHATAQRVMRRLPDGSRMDFTTAGRIVAGRYHTCAIESGSGQPMCWGANNAGQLGDNTTISRDDAMPAGLFGAIKLAAGNGHTCAVRANDMYCWGTAFMGNGAERQTLLTPVAAGRVDAHTDSPDPVAAAAAGERHTCVLRASGDVQCWGWNNAGQAGIGSISDTVNVLVPTSTNAGAVFWRP